jgi:hypothetical protein
MLPVMEAYAKIAAEYGDVDPLDPKAVEQFFEHTLPSFDGAKQQDVLDHLLELTTGSSGRPQHSKSAFVFQVTKRMHLLEQALFVLSQNDEKRTMNVLERWEFFLADAHKSLEAQREQSDDPSRDN